MAYNLIIATIHIKDEYDEDDTDTQSIKVLYFSDFNECKKHLQLLLRETSDQFIDIMLEQQSHVSLKKYSSIEHFFIKRVEEEFSCELDELSYKPVKYLLVPQGYNLDGYKKIFNAWNKGVSSSDIYHMILYWIEENKELCTGGVRKYLQRVLERMDSNESSKDIVEDFIDRNILDADISEHSDSDSDSESD